MTGFWKAGNAEHSLTYYLNNNTMEHFAHVKLSCGIAEIKYTYPRPAIEQDIVFEMQRESEAHRQKLFTQIRDEFVGKFVAQTKAAVIESITILDVTYSMFAITMSGNDFELLTGAILSIPSKTYNIGEVAQRCMEVAFPDLDF
jgi:hypothetical protein